MNGFAKIIAGVAVLALPVAALASASDFTLANGTGAAISGISIKRTGTPGWRTLSPGLSAGAKSKIAFNDVDCAFDIKANVGGSEAVWAGVNLCEVSNVTLRRDGSGMTWADYD